MNIFQHMQLDDFEQVIFHQDQALGLQAITAIHDTTLGPALGGIRYYAYANEEDALTDALRLAKGMTYKNAVAGLPHGGGKTVILKDPNVAIDEEGLFRLFGRFVEGLNGRYIPSVDIGTTSEHLDFIHFETKHVVGSNQKVGASGNPSPSTAYGVYLGMKVAVAEVFGSDTLSNRTLLVEGFGKVGAEVAERALAEGARVLVTDVSEEAKAAARALGCEVVDDLLAEKADIYVPCAMGGTLNDANIARLESAGVKIVAGSANNQLADEHHGQVLKAKNILYVPDYVINAGGVIHVADELNGGFDAKRTRKKVEGIATQVQAIFHLAEKENLPMNQAANRLAEKRIASVRQTQKVFKG